MAFRLLHMIRRAASLTGVLLGALGSLGVLSVPGVIPVAEATAVAIRPIGTLNGTLARRLLPQVRSIPAWTRGDDVPILMQGRTVESLTAQQQQAIAATYRAGYPVVLLDATLQQVAQLREIVGEGITYRSKDSGLLSVYALRREFGIPSALLLTTTFRGSRLTATGAPDPTDMQDHEAAFDRAAERALAELKRGPGTPSADRAARAAASGSWMDTPIQTQTFALNSPGGIFNTVVYVYALHSCLEQKDHYVVTAEADWTATQAKWQSAGADLWPNKPTMGRDANGNLWIDWQDGREQYGIDLCSSPGWNSGGANICRYANYPLGYSLQMNPLTKGTVIQINAAPAATQGEQTTYSSGFSFNIGGTVNISGSGPGAGIGAGVTWSNMQQTTVPPLVVEVGNTANEGVQWAFRYCTTGLDPDPGSSCTSHVQMVKNVCQAQLGNPSSGTNPQQGQTPLGKFSNAVQSAHWQAGPDTRQNPTFDIEVAFEAQLADTIAHLSNADTESPDPTRGCNYYSCDCVAETRKSPVTHSYTFQIPLPANVCK